MDINIEIWCTKCNSKMDTSENVYCESCIDAKDEPDKIIDGVARLNCDEKELAKKYTEKIMVWFFKNRERYFRDILYEDAKNIVEKILQSRQPELFSELAEIIKWLYTSEKVQLAQSDITKIVNRLEAIEKLLQPRQGSKDELALIENLADIDWLTQEDMMCLESIRRKLGGEDE